MKVVMVGPVPGIAPNTVPTSVPRTIGQNASLISARDGRMSFMLILVLLMVMFTRLTLTRKSAMPNRPMKSAPSSTPSARSGRSKV